MEFNELLEQIDEFKAQNKEVLDEIVGLTYGNLVRDLDEAKNYRKGYYKNKKGVYWYVKGIEVTNETWNLLRMGYNGEDRGVWIHYCEVTDSSVKDLDVPLCAFTSMFNPRFTDEENLMRPTTKSAFTRKVHRVVNRALADYPEKRGVEEYLDVAKKWGELSNELYDMMFPEVGAELV